MKRRWGQLAYVAFICSLLLAFFGSSASSAKAEDEGAKDGMLTIRGIDGTDRKAVEVTVLWTGNATDLSKMALRENGAERKVTDLVDFREAGRGMGTVIVMDLSGSMNNDGALSRAKAAVAEMAENIPEGDLMAVVSFSNDPEVETAFTSSAGQINAALEGMAAPSDGRTAMYDGIRKAVTLFETRPALQPNILLVTDGSDDVSGASLEEARASVVSAGAAFFAVELTHMDGEVDSGAIRSIIDRTGGATYSGTTEAEIAKAFTDVTTTMRSQFVATYESQVEQGAIDLTISVGGQEDKASFVAGSKAEGASTAQVVTTKKAFGPDWLRSSPILPVLFVGLAVGLGIYAAINLAGSRNENLQSVLSPYTEGAPLDSDSDSSLAQTAFLQRAVEMTEEFAERQGFLEKVAALLEKADLPLRAAEALFFYVVGVALVSLMAIFGLGLIPGLIVAVIAAMIPMAAVSFIAGQRARKFVAQLPDMLHLLSGSLRAGYSLMQGVEAVSQEVEEPMGKELRRVVTEARLGRELEESLDAVADRMASPDFAWAVMAIRIQREVGGNLSELLLTVAETMVQRDRLRRDINSLTAEGRMSAIILGLLPVGLGFFMYTSNPDYMEPLFSTGLGQVMLGLAVVSALVGFAWMKKTITIEI